VEFRATAHDGDTVTSQTFDWASSGGSGSSFSADFHPKEQGNEWWVEVDVDASEDLSKVEARVDGGEWRQLDHKWWGSWAKSVHVDGSTVEFRATSQSGQTVTSTTYGW
jgi:hypothetical protein